MAFLEDATFSNNCDFHIINGTFCGTRNLKRIAIPSSVRELISCFVFSAVKEVIFAEDSELEILWATFDSSSIEKITIPLKVTVIKESTFSHCFHLTEVSFQE